MKEPEIRCPQCKWRPKMESRWCCNPGCQHEWHTFWTAGVCPGCAKAWITTMCLSCHALSLHKDWYHFPDEDEKAVEEDIVETADA